MSNKFNFNRELFQSLGTISALLISILALVVSIFEASILRTQQKATVWPYVSLQQGFNSDGFSLVAMNKGVGPAMIKSIQVDYNGKPVSTYMELLQRAKPDNQLTYSNISTNKFNGVVMAPNESIVLMDLPWGPDTNQILEMLGDSVKIKIQYCSVLDECWYYEYPADIRNQKNFKATSEFKD